MLIVLGVRPFEFTTDDAAAVVVSVVILLLHLMTMLICFAKHRMVHGLFGLFFPPLAWYGAARIGKPDSPWGRRFYGERNPKKQAKAEHRFRPGRRTDRFKEGLRTAIGGSTEQDYLAKVGAEGVAWRPWWGGLE